MAGNMLHTPGPHFYIKIATNIVHAISPAAALVLKPKAKKSPPTASLKAPIQAKNIGNIAKTPPYSATSPGNQ